MTGSAPLGSQPTLFDTESGRPPTRDAQADRLARAALTRLGEPGDLRIARLVEEVGAVRTWELLVEQDVRVPAANTDLTASVSSARADVALRAADVDAAIDLEQAEKAGIRFVVPGDDEWPHGLDDLGHAGAVQRRGGVPCGLWVRGRRLDELAAAAVAFVGSRSATAYGTTTAAELAAYVGEHGAATVSGAAFGIDQAAHRAALAVDAGTVAVLACGVDRAYPAAHEQLLRIIAERGAVVSELPPGCAPTRVRFLARNRLIAAMSQATVVVEAAVRSGALNTAHWAGRLHRPLLGVPGPVTSAASAGVHEMIRTRDALMVTHGDHVLEVIGGSDHAVGLQRAQETSRDLLPRALRELVEGVPVSKPVSTRAVARAVAVTEAAARDGLAQLAARGLVVREEDGWRLATGPRADLDAPATPPTVDW